MGKHTAKHTAGRAPKRPSVQADMTPEAPAAHRASNKRTLPIVLIAILGVLVVLLAAAALFIWRTSGMRNGMFEAQSTIPTPIPTVAPTAEPLKGEEPVIDADWIDANGDTWNYREDIVAILLMGIDYMNDEDRAEEGKTVNGGNADVLALAVLDTTSNTLSLLHIPRDTMAEVMILDESGNYQDMRTQNITTAHRYGDGGAVSCELTVDAVSRLLNGIPIQRYASVSYDVLYDLNDLIGGVTITFDEDEDFTDVDPDFAPGQTVTLTDEQLYRFVTYRDKTQLDSAYDRGQRHMLLLNVLFDQCKAAFQEDVSFPIQMYNRGMEYLTTNLTVSEIGFLAQQVFQADFHTDAVYTLEGEMTMGNVYAEYIPDQAWIHDYVVNTFCVPAE